MRASVFALIGFVTAGGMVALALEPSAGRTLRGLVSRTMPRGSGLRDPGSAPPDGYRENLPKFASMLDVLLAWNPDDANEPLEGSKFDTLELLDWSSEAGRKRAFELRDLEIPFKITNMSNLDEVKAKWADDEYVISSMEARSQYMVNTAHNGHFMFYQNGAMRQELRQKLRPKTGYSSGTEAKSAFRSSGYTFDHPPPVPVPMGFREFWELSARLEAENKRKSPAEEAESRHVYLTTGGAYNGKGDTMIGRDIRLFVDEDTRDFFLPDRNDIRGQHCRVGMRGVVAEQHWDGHRNSIYMLRGAKRYILNPPGACVAMQMMHSGPSRRHAGIDFSDPDALSDPETAAQLAKADTVETVLRAGEVLYVPSYWLHYIVSLGRSIQCNTRSGISPIFGEDAKGIDMCETGKPPPPATADEKAAAVAAVEAAMPSFRLPEA